MKSEITLREGLLGLEVEGEVTGAEALELWKRLAFEFPSARCALALVKKVTWKMSGAQVRSLASRVDELPCIPRALVTADTMVYGMIRMFTGWITNDEQYNNFAVFRDVPSAEAWLATRAPGCACFSRAVR